jgi:very-short-patch-repair endonuclease
MSSISKETYVTRNFQKISGKRWELYVITRVIHLLDDEDIEYVCQQYINPPQNKEYYLADLAFPSLKLYLEIDEGQHGSDLHKASDIKRDAEILQATDWECVRIKVFETANNSKVDKKLKQLNLEIEDFVKYVRKKKEQFIQDGHDISWNYEEKFLPESFIKKNIIKVNDNVSLLNHRDVLRLFGYKKGHYQRAVWKIDRFNEMVWFPKLYPNADWVNEFEENTSSILQHRKDMQPHHPIPKKDDHSRIVFAHQKNIFGQTVYKFYGVFEVDTSRTDPVHHCFKRIKDSINLEKYRQ